MREDVAPGAGRRREAKGSRKSRALAESEGPRRPANASYSSSISSTSFMVSPGVLRSQHAPAFLAARLKQEAEHPRARAPDREIIGENCGAGKGLGPDPATARPDPTERARRSRAHELRRTDRSTHRAPARRKGQMPGARDNNGALPVMNEAESPPPASSPSAVRAFVVPASLHGARLDKGIAQLLPELSRARVKRAIELGAVRVNGRRMPKGGTLSEGDAVRIDVAQVIDVPAVGTPGAPLKIVLESAQVVIVDKPAGQATAPIRPGESARSSTRSSVAIPELVPTARLVHRPLGARARHHPSPRHRDERGRGRGANGRGVRDAQGGAAGGPPRQALLAPLRRAGAGRRGIHRVSSHEPPEGPAPRLRVHPSARRHALRAAARRRRAIGSCSARARGRSSRRRSARRCATRSARTFAAIGHPLAGDELYGGPVIRALGRHALHAARVAYAGGDGVDAFDASVPLPKDMAALLEAAAAGAVTTDIETTPVSSER